MLTKDIPQKLPILPLAHWLKHRVADRRLEDDPVDLRLVRLRLHAAHDDVHYHGPGCHWVGVVQGVGFRTRDVEIVQRSQPHF